MTTRIALSLALLAATAAPAFAGTQQPARVVELFTSQGCSSCPPANRFVAKLDAEQTDVLALSYGVTYWDYLGWEDTFGDPAFTDRQRQYRDSLGSNMYTPQMVINGADDAPRFKRRDVERHSLTLPVVLSETASGFSVSGDIPVGATLAVVDYRPGTQEVAVKRGENGGRTLTLANVVTGVAYHRWDGTALSVTARDAGLAVLVHDPESAAIVGAVSWEE